MKLGRDKTVTEIVSALNESKSSTGSVVKVQGSWGSFGALLAGHIFDELDRPIVYICPHIDDAEKLSDDLYTFTSQKADVLPAWEGVEDLADATDQIRAERLRIALKLMVGQSQFIIPVSVQALCQAIPDPQAIKQSCLGLQVGAEVPPQKIAGWLVDNSFEHVERIDLPGQFARRGGIIDIYAPLVTEVVADNDISTPSSQNAEAIRIEFFGDTIESIRQIDLDTHRSTSQIDSIDIVSAVWGANDKQRELFLNLLPGNTIIILEQPGDIEDVANVFFERCEEPDRLFNWQQIYDSLKKFTQLHLYRFAPALPEQSLKLEIKTTQQFQHTPSAAWAGHKQALELLVQQSQKGKHVYLYCEKAAEIKRLTEIIQQSFKVVPKNFKLLQGFIHQGFVIDSLDTIVISHHELFGQYVLRRRQRPVRPSIAIDTLADLNPGDYVVHVSYGIGKFLGIKTIKDKSGQSEYLTIEFADRIKMHVSANNITLIQKYIGTSPKRPRLSKIGSKKWQKQKEKVAQSVSDLASELLELQAKRQSIGGISFGEDTTWQAEFEESFAYTETADQTTAAEQIKADMQQPTAMDRLLCGDVGYGKTELAMRAAFKAVEGGKQVAMLVPTTVLCVQHGRTFNERFADFPISIEVLNRFKTAKQAADIIERTKEGRVDILIGTHRLLSKDVGFKDLGLLIIDEEQRFGVRHKEKLKKIRVNVEFLTMTATPIPRTLHMSLLGLRDISSLGTPPLDRRSVVTTVTAYSDPMIRKAVIRELNRQGQVFFLHNRVKTIEKKALEIEKLLEGAGARIAIAHGRMSKQKLEKAMLDFVLGKIDVLVCTTIIESGLDIPNANTIFIDNADRFGLAELHQLRGRVGRYKHRAYAYMLLPKSRPITPIAARRLKAIEEYSYLGAGFRIALRDLEIRGAGNILGSEQSGHIQVVGYQMYCDMLADSVRSLKGQPIERIPSVNIDLGFTTYIPKNYIPTDRHRMDIYRKIAAVTNTEDLKQLEDELADVYGPVPEEVELLLEIAELRIAAAPKDIKSIIVSGQNLIFSFTDTIAQKAKSLFTRISAKPKVTDSKTILLRLEKNYFEPKTLLTILRKILISY